MVSKTIFVKGHGLTKREQLDVHRDFKSISKEILGETGSIVPIIHTGAPPGDINNAFTSKIRGIHATHLQIAKIREMSVGTLDSLVKENMIEYVSTLGILPALIAETVKRPAAAAKKVVKKYEKEIKNTAKQAALLAFASALFRPPTNMLGVTPWTNDYAPYITDVLIGTVPFYSVQRIERAMSDRILKYRAIGDIFLAHQRGSNDTLRIDLTLFGPWRLFYLLYLLSLQQKGEAKLKGLSQSSRIEDVAEKPNALPGDRVKIAKDQEDKEVQYETHTTFPIITNNAIMLDMFLQTIEWNQEKSKGGNEVIYATLLFRKHIDPKGYTVFKKSDKTGWLYYGDTITEKIQKELLLDTAWKVLEIGKETINVGLFGGSDMFSIDREAIAEDPYTTNIYALAGGYSFDRNNAGSIATM